MLASSSFAIIYVSFFLLLFVIIIELLFLFRCVLFVIVLL